jgi:hypothetical protein
MEMFAHLMSGAAFFLWIAAILAAVVTANSPYESAPEQERKTAEPTGAGYRWQFE